MEANPTFEELASQWTFLPSVKRHAFSSDLPIGSPYLNIGVIR